MASANCVISGNTDMYGIGIRIGFYLQWFASPLAAWIAPEELPAIQTANAFFVSATFLGLIVQVTTKGLDIAEIYVILLLTFGVNVFMLPILLWRILTGFSPNWDPTQFPKGKPPSHTFNALFTMVQCAVVSFQTWFWAKKIPSSENECPRYGFIFHKIRLNSEGFRIFNFVVTVILLVLVFGFTAANMVQSLKAWVSQYATSTKYHEDGPPSWA
jgi:hypothetical protein